MPNAYALFSKSNYPIGGAEINLYNLALAFYQTGNYDVEFLVGDFGQPKVQVFENITLHKYHDFEGSKNKPIKDKILRKYRFLKWLLLNNANYYILSCASEETAFFVFFSQMLKRKKVIFRIASDWDINGYYTKSGNRLGKLYEFALRRFSAIVAQNEIQKTMLHEAYNLNSKVIKNGFPILESNQDVYSKKDYFLWVGKSDSNKRPQLFLELANRLPNFKFKMIIPGENELKLEIELQSKKIPNLELIGYVNYFEITSYYTFAKCVVITSETEGFPNVLIQACLERSPILSFNVNPDSLINKYNLGCFCDENMETAVHFLESLTTDKIKAMGDNCLTYVQSNHDITEKVNQYEKLFT